MSRTNCQCGMLPVANCVRCSNGACEDHLQRLRSRVHRLRGQSIFGYGATLADAARMKGYLSAPVNTFVCDICRTSDGNDLMKRVVTESRSWPSDPLIRAFTAIRQGLVHEDHGLDFWQMVDRWLKLPIPPTDITLSYLKRPARMPIWTPFGKIPYRPAESGSRHEQGWEFPGTVRKEYEHRGRLMGTHYFAWGGVTHIARSGEVWADNVRLERGQSVGNLHLLVEMARQATMYCAASWNGPDTGWELPKFKVGDPL